METAKNSVHSSVKIWSLLICALTTVWGFVSGAVFELTDQEAYYWWWSQHLDFSYFDHPPLQAWLTRASTELFGQHVWAVRLPGQLGRLALLALVFVWAKQRQSNNESAGWLALATLCSSFFFLGGALVALPDGVMLPMAFLAIVFATKNRSFLAGVALGFAGLGKWTAVVLAPGIAWALWKQRSSTRQGLLSVGVVSATAIAMQWPVLWWNHANQWAAFRYHFFHRPYQRSESFADLFSGLGKFLGNQVALGTFGFVLVLVAFVVFFGRSWWKVLLKPWTFQDVLWMAPAFLLFGWSAMKGETRFYWTSIAFVPLAVVLSVAFSNAARPGQCLKLLKWQSTTTVLLMIAVTSALVFPIGAWLKPWVSPPARYDMRWNPRGDLYGWGELIAQLRQTDPRLNQTSIVLASNFRLSAQLAWLFRNDSAVQVGTANPEQNQLQFWKNPLTQKDNRPVLFVGDNRRRPQDLFDGFCAHRLDWKKMPILQMGHVIREFHWAVCTSYQVPQWARTLWESQNTRVQ